jgi:hypothetical protein
MEFGDKTFSPRWWGTLVTENGLFVTHPRDTIPYSQILVCYQSSNEPGGRKFTLVPTLRDLQILITNYPHCYEVIRGEQPQRLYFDIDVQRKELLSQIVKSEGSLAVPDETTLSTKVVELAFQTIMAIITIFHEVGVEYSEWRIYHSRSRSGLPSKGSCHLILTGRQGSTALHLKKLAEWVYSQLPSSLQPWMDPKVYKSLQQLRFLGCCKAGDDRYKELVSEWQLSDTKIEVPLEKRNGLNALSESLVGYFDESLPKRLPLPDIPSLAYEPISYEIPSSLLEVELSEIIELVADFVPNQVVFQKEQPPFLIFKRIAPGYCPICCNVVPHEHENPFVLLTKREIRYYCRRHPRDCWLLGTLPDPALETPLPSLRDVGGAKKFKVTFAPAPLPRMEYDPNKEKLRKLAQGY